MAWILLAALLIAEGVPYHAAAKRPASDPAALCAARKLAATGGTASADLRCHGKAAAKGRTVEASCLAVTRQPLERIRPGRASGKLRRDG